MLFAIWDHLYKLKGQKAPSMDKWYPFCFVPIYKVWEWCSTGAFADASNSSMLYVQLPHLNPHYAESNHVYPLAGTCNYIAKVT